MVRVPAAIGFRNPMIVFPAWTLQELSPEEINVILIHELAHVRRRDDWTNLLQKIVRAVFFFHPAVWWIDTRLSLEREMACDDAVLAETGNPRAYASCLVDLLEKSCARRGWAMAQAAVHRAHEASLRIAQILDPHRPTATRVRRLAPGLAGIFSVACVGILFSAPQLVAFMPETVALKTSIAETGDSAAISANSMPATAVIPASFHISSPVKRTMEKPTIHRQEQAALHLAVAKRDSVHAGTAPRVVMAKAERHANSRVPMLFLVETTEIETRPGSMNSTEAVSSSRQDPNAKVQIMQHGDFNEMTWRIQVWRVVFMSRAEAELQAGVTGKSI
jgi:hypothetical protein